MIERAEATGLGVALAAHAALLAVLSLGFATATKPVILAPPMEVSFVDEVGLEAAVTEASPDDAQQAEAPETGPPEDAAPAPAPVAEPLPKPVPPAPAKASEAPAEVKKPAKPAPAKPAKAAPAKPVVKKPQASGVGTAAKPRGSRLGADFLKGLSDPSTGKATKPKAAVSSRNMAGLAQAIAAQVKPCYVVPSGGTDAASIKTVLRLRFRKDGTNATPPTVVEQPGVNADNRAYARQMADAAKRAVLRCAPLKLPAELYEGGWEDIEFVFNPRAMG